MQFYPSQRVAIDIQMTSGKTDSFEALQDLLDKKESLALEIANEFADKLSQNAGKKLYSTKEAYDEAISIQDGQVVLDTSTFVVGMVENGVPTFDMKVGLLNSSKVKTSKNGQKYLVVPLSTTKHGKHNWRDRETGKFKAGTSGVKGTEFRIVSENSPASSWIFPAYEGNHFIEQTLSDFDNGILNTFVDDKIDAVLEKL